jgi:hypothetical protein
MLLRIEHRNHDDRIGFLIATPAVVEASLLLDDRLICPSTFKTSLSLWLA